MKKAAVLMSTYNGQEFLSDQIKSVLEQDNVDISLYIRDDGSKDKTLSIIHEFQNKYSNIHLMEGNNIGVGNSFMTLLYAVPSEFDYYAFSDQDDIWMKDKISSAITVLEMNKNTNLYCSNQILIDKYGNKIGIRFAENPDVTCEQSFLINHMTGCTMVWNHQLQIMLQDKKHRPSKRLLENRIHDVWVAVVGGFTGSTFYDPDSHIYYRQHENNVVGAKEDGPLEVLKCQLKKIKDPKYRNGRSWIAREVCEKFPEYVNKHPLLLVASGENTASGRINILKNNKELRSHTREGRFSFGLKVLLGLF